MSRRKKLLFLASRNYSNEKSGRGSLVRQYLGAAENSFEVTIITILPREFNYGLLSLLITCCRLMLLLIFSRRPLQSVLLPPNISGFRSLESGWDVILIDGLRIASNIDFPRLRKKSRSKIIVDVDDALSKRYREYLRLGLSIEFGSMGSHLSLLSHFLPTWAARVYYRTEARRFEELENYLHGAVDRLVYTSPVEAALAMDTSLYPEKIWSQPVYVANRAPPNDEFVYFTQEVIRVGFIGSDSLPQNKTSLRFLLDSVERSDHIELIVAGSMSRTYSHGANTRFLGQVPELTDFYKSIDVLCVPTFVAGGIKTKVLEAFSYGVPVIGTTDTFLGLPLPITPPVFEASKLQEMLKTSREELINAVKAARKFRDEFRELNSKNSYETSVQLMLT